MPKTVKKNAKRELAELVYVILRQHRRFDEVIYRKRSDLADEIVKVAKTVFAKDFRRPFEASAFRRRFLQTGHCGEYWWDESGLMNRDFDIFCSLVGKPEENGIAIAKSIVYHYALFQGKILFFVDAIVETILHHADEIDAGDIPLVAPHFIRSIIGHERRHKMQDFFSKYGDLRDFLMDTSKETPLDEALEDDADWFEAHFLTWFWDGVDRLEDEERWRNSSKGSVSHAA